MTDPDFLQVPPMRILETERLRLRTVRMSDAAALLPIVTDETTMKYTSGLIANDMEAVERWLSARALGKDILNFVITLKDDGPAEGGEVVGIMGSYHWPEIGYLMNPGMLPSKLPTYDGMF
jgi:RimJ/RimL family protein N-acetyltransferase